ncbi:hypothetical protein L218DRAFT_588682 [Marasmius fiardii PR-910]|nr:hypothetical protein L218DRAFT_588682 [Marasmius fiardii PR-910]
MVHSNGCNRMTYEICVGWRVTERRTMNPLSEFLLRSTRNPSMSSTTLSEPQPLTQRLNPHRDLDNQQKLSPSSYLTVAKGCRFAQLLRQKAPEIQPWKRGQTESTLMGRHSHQ